MVVERTARGTHLQRALHAESAQYQRDLEALVESLAAGPQTSAHQQEFFDRKSELLSAVHRRKHQAAANILTSAQLKILDAGLQNEMAREASSQRAALIQAELERRAAAK